jgi:hypothetical protein
MESSGALYHSNFQSFLILLNHDSQEH